LKPPSFCLREILPPYLANLRFQAFQLGLAEIPLFLFNPLDEAVPNGILGYIEGGIFRALGWPLPGFSVLPVGRQGVSNWSIM